MTYFSRNDCLFLVSQALIQSYTENYLPLQIVQNVYMLPCLISFAVLKLLVKIQAYTHTHIYTQRHEKALDSVIICGLCWNSFSLLCLFLSPFCRQTHTHTCDTCYHNNYTNYSIHINVRYFCKTTKFIFCKNNSVFMLKFILLSQSSKIKMLYKTAENVPVK